MINAVKNSSMLKAMLMLSMLCVVLFLLGGCRGLPPDSGEEWISSVQNCWPCIIYKSVFDAVNVLIMMLYPTIASKAILLMGIGLLFWLAFTTGKFVTTLHEPDIKKYVLSVMLVLFKAIVVFSILYNKEDFLCVIDMIVTPVLTLFTELSRIVITANSNINNGLVWPESFKETTLKECNLFSGQVVYQLQDIIFRVYVALNSGIGLGRSVMVTGGFLNWIIGPFIIWMFFVLMLFFPWMFIDSFVRLGSVLVLSPIFLVAWVFPSTKDAVKAAWKIIFGAAMQLLIACIYIGLVVGVINIFADQNWPGMFGESRQTADPSMFLNFKRLSIEAVSFFALILIMSRMQKNIPNISGALGGDDKKSEMISFMDGVKQLAISATQIAVGALLSAFGVPGGATMMKSGAKKIAKQAKDTAKKATEDTMETGSGEGNGGS